MSFVVPNTLIEQWFNLPSELAAIVQQYLAPCPFQFDPVLTPQPRLVLSADRKRITAEAHGVLEGRYDAALGFASFSCSPLVLVAPSALLKPPAKAGSAPGAGTTGSASGSSDYPHVCAEWAVSVDHHMVTVGIARRTALLGGETLTHSDEHSWSMTLYGHATNGSTYDSDGHTLCVRYQFLDGVTLHPLQPMIRPSAIEPSVVRVRCDLTAGTVAFAFGRSALSDWRVGLRGIRDLCDWYPYVTVSGRHSQVEFVAIDYALQEPVLEDGDDIYG